MTKGMLTYLFIVLILAMDISISYAGTDLLSNTLTQSNSFLKEAGLVQKKYSGILRKAVTTKISINLDALNIKKIEKYKEKAENLKEKADKLKDRIETAKERKEELMNKYNELNSKALEYKGKADNLIAEGNKIKEKYQTYSAKASEAITKAKELKNDAEDAIASVKSQVDDFTSAGAENATNATPQEASSNNASPSQVDINKSTNATENMEYGISQFGDTEFTEDVKNSIDADSTNYKTLNSAAINMSSQADAIRTASTLANKAQVSDLKIDNNASLNDIALKDVSISDVMEAAQYNQDNVTPVTNIKSNLNIQDQLNQTVNRSDLRVSELQAEDQLINYNLPSKSLLRSSFDQVAEQPLTKDENLPSKSLLRSSFDQVAEQPLTKDEKILTNTTKEKINVKLN